MKKLEQWLSNSALWSHERLIREGVGKKKEKELEECQLSETLGNSLSSPTIPLYFNHKCLAFIYLYSGISHKIFTLKTVPLHNLVAKKPL